MEIALVKPVNDLSRYPQIPHELLRNACVLPDRWAGIAMWPTDAVVVEVGVALGVFSQAIIERCRPSKFIAIDRFDLHELESVWGVPTAEHFGGRTHKAFYCDRFAGQIAAGQVEVIEGDSSAAIASLPDQSVDVFYVDADHRYDGVRLDLEALLPKVKPHGWIVMNDYVPADTFSDEPLGVIQATNEFMAREGWEMAYFALAPIMYCDVGLRRTGQPKPAYPSERPRERLLRLEQRAADLESALEATHRSTSWRITAPLRWTKRRLQSLAGR
jgi:hypothetical protein